MPSKKLKSWPKKKSKVPSKTAKVPEISPVTWHMSNVSSEAIVRTPGHNDDVRTSTRRRSDRPWSDGTRSRPLP